jgi:hypothetical protein
LAFCQADNALVHDLAVACLLDVAMLVAFTCVIASAAGVGMSEVSYLFYSIWRLIRRTVEREAITAKIVGYVRARGWI